MTIEIGQVEAIFRYPVKSMAGERVEVANMGWHGIDGDRRLALRRTKERSGFPWLTATTLPDLLLFTPPRGCGAAPPSAETPGPRRSSWRRRRARTIRKFSRRVTPLGSSSEVARRVEDDNGSRQWVVPSARG